MTKENILISTTQKRGLSVKDAAGYCGVSKELLNKLRSHGTVNGITGPHFVKIGNKVIYFIESLDTWLDSFIGARSLAEMSQLRLESEKNGEA